MAHVSAIDKINQDVEPHKVLDNYNFKRVEKYGDTIMDCSKVHGRDNTSAFVYHIDKEL